MRACLWILFAVAAIALTVWVAELSSNPTLVDTGAQEEQVRDYRALAASIDAQRLRDTIERLASLGSRVTGYPGSAMMVTDTAMFRYPYYHSMLDTPERLDYKRMARVVSGLEAVARGLANPGLADSKQPS